MGKGLNSNNHMGWMAQRTRSYSAPLGLKHSDGKIHLLRPSLAICERFNKEVKAFWKIRRLYFIFLWSMSKKTDLLSLGARVCVNLLRNAEITNMHMIMVWILSLNDILLGWHELCKFVPFLCAAYAKYQQVGPMAPWLKMILPPDEVTEFSADKLKVLFSVARAISAKYGGASANQIEGVSKISTTDKIVEQALKIIAIAGGARTIDTMALRLWKLDHHQNRALIHQLDTGALNTTIEDEQHDDAIEEGERMAI